MAKTQPQQLLEAIVPQETSTVPEWVDQEWRKEIAEKWAIKVAGEMVATCLREMIGAVTPQARLKSIVALEHWVKANAKPTIILDPRKQP